jgi:hypothetical protein
MLFPAVLPGGAADAAGLLVDFIGDFKGSNALLEAALREVRMHEELCLTAGLQRTRCVWECEASRGGSRRFDRSPDRCYRTRGL